MTLEALCAELGQHHVETVRLVALYDEDWADQNSFTFLGSLRFLPTDDITIDLSGTWSTEHTKGLIGRCITADPDAPLPDRSLTGGVVGRCSTSSG